MLLAMLAGGVATHYGLDPPEAQTPGEAIFSAPVQTGPGA